MVQLCKPPWYLLGVLPNLYAGVHVFVQVYEVYMYTCLGVPDVHEVCSYA